MKAGHDYLVGRGAGGAPGGANPRYSQAFQRLSRKLGLTVRLGVAAVFAGQSERAVGWCATDDDRSSPGPSSSGGVSHRLLGVDPVGPLPLRGPDPVPSSVPPSLGGPDVYTMSVSSRGAAGVVHGPGLLARLSSQVRLRPLEDRRCARSQVTLARSRCQWPRRARLAPGVRARAVP